MFSVLLLILQIAKTAAVYSYHETSEEIPYLYNDSFLSGFRNVTDKDFILGGLFPVNDCTGSGTGMDGVELLEAMLFAIDQINNDMNLLPNLTIGYDVRDTCSDSVIGLDEAINIIRLAEDTYPLLGIVGPAATSVTLTVASIFDLQVPLVGYASSYPALSNKHLYKSFLRTIPSDSLQSKAMADLVSFFKWEYVSVIFNDDTYGNSGINVFIDSAMQRNICLDKQIPIPSPEMSRINVNTTMHIEKAVKTLLNSTASVVIVYTDEETVLALFQELNKVNGMRKFIWIASDRWANSRLVYDKFPEIANGTIGFQPQHNKKVEEFTDYFSQLIPSTNVRDPFFPEYYESYCNENGTNCPNGDVTSNSNYSQGDAVSFTIDAVYAFVHAIQNFLDNNCDSPLRWDHATLQCDGMKHQLTSKTLLAYLFNVTFSGIQNRTVSFDENGDPSGLYKISHLQANDNGQYDYVSIGFWDSINKENTLILNGTDEIEKVVSKCSHACDEGMIRSFTNPKCPSCFRCIPCVGSTYSINSSANNCSLCSDNHWGNNPLSGSTHCVPIKVRHSDFSSIWSIVSMCISTIILLILAIVTVIFFIKRRYFDVFDKMLLIGIGTHCVLIFVVVAPPSITVCVFQRVGVWLCFSFIFGVLLVTTVHMTRLRLNRHDPFSDPKYQIMFTMGIVFGQLIIVVIGLGVDPPVVTNFIQQAGDAPEIFEICRQPHTAILVLSFMYVSCVIFASAILGWMIRKFKQIYPYVITSFTLMVVWVLFQIVYFSAKIEFQTGILAIDIVLSATAFMSAIFFQLFHKLQVQHHNDDYTATQYSQTHPKCKPLLSVLRILLHKGIR